MNSELMLNKRRDITTVKREEGYILVMVAVLLVVMLALTALAIDVGVQYAARTQSQAAADAAALAGAYTFTTTGAQPATAQNEAKQVAISNHTAQGVITVAQVTAVADVANRRVAVDIDTDQPTFFSKVLGFNTAHVHTRSVAEAAPFASASPCTKPWFVPNSLGTMPPCSPGGACSGGPNVLIAGTPPQKTAYAQMLIDGSNMGLNEFVMKPQTPGGAIAPSDFYGIIISGNGANDYSDAIGSCVDDAVLNCQLSYNVKTGNMKGPTADGVNQLIGNPPQDTYISPDHYRHPDNKVYNTSRALVTAPVMDLCSYPGFCPSGGLPSGGNVNLTVKGFAQFFVEGVAQSGPNQGNVTGRLVNVFPCDSAVTPPSGGSTTGSGVPLRLVREE